MTGPVHVPPESTGGYESRVVDSLRHVATDIKRAAEEVLASLPVDTRAFDELRSEYRASMQALREATAQAEKAEAVVREYRDGAARVLAERCAPDERHCTCVPALRRETALLKARALAAENLLRGMVAYAGTVCRDCCTGEEHGKRCDFVDARALLARIEEVKP